MKQNAQHNNQQGRLIPVTQWANDHPWPPLGGLRHLIFNAEKNGFSTCIIRVGRRVLIDENKFYAWINDQQDRTDLEV